MYIGVNNVARKISNCYVGVNGVARKVKAVYVGVNGVARLVWKFGKDKKLFSRYLSFNKCTSNVAEWYVVDEYGSKRQASLNSCIPSSVSSKAVLCNLSTAWSNSYGDGTGSSYNVNSIQKFTLDSNYNATVVGRAHYNRSSSSYGYSGSMSYGKSYFCNLYLDLGDYVFLCLYESAGTSVYGGYYCVYDWSDNQICMLKRDYNYGSYGYDYYMPQSGYNISNSKIIVGVSSSDSSGIGIINFNGSSLTQKYFYVRQYGFVVLKIQHQFFLLLQIR